MQMHANQLTVSPETVRTLVDRQFPEWRSLPVRSIAAQGTVNALFRIGDRFAARFPLESADVESTRRLLASEAEAARELAGRTRFPTPEPVALGEPGAGYQLPWSVQTWLLPGTVADDADPGESDEGLSAGSGSPSRDRNVIQRLVIRDHDGRRLIVHKTRTDFLVSGLDEPYVGPTPGLPPDRLLRLISREGGADLLMAYGTGRDTLLWDPQSGQVSQISGVPWHLHSVPDRDGPAALAGLHDGGLAVIWQQQGADWRPAAAMRVGPVHAVTALPSRHGSWRLATAGEDGIRLWEQPKGSRPTGDQIPARRPRVDRDVRAISLGSLVYGGEHAWALGTTEGVQLLRRADLRPIHQLGGRPPVYDIFPATPERNSDLLAVRTETAIEVWDIASNEITLTVPVDQRARACAVELRPDPPHHLTGGPALCVSTPQEGLRVHKLHPDTTVPECSFDLSSRITSLAPVPSEDRTLVAIGASRWVYVWNLDRDAATARLSTGTPAPVESLCTLNSPDGLLLAAASRDAIHVWHTADWRPVATITALDTKKLSYLTGKDGASLLASGDGHSIRIWDPWTGAPVHTLLTAASVYALAANGTDGTLAFGGPAGFAVVDFSALAP
ncbi:protein kinase family protein [Streptomyces canus]|uniref:protein kinase family protein n=1 Tax=Streptomyces canus TaxID=58343 RepID=UPI00324F373A